MHIGSIPTVKEPVPRFTVVVKITEYLSGARSQATNITLPREVLVSLGADDSWPPQYTMAWRGMAAYQLAITNTINATALTRFIVALSRVPSLNNDNENDDDRQKENPWTPETAARERESWRR
mgnify:CR=1 FL=1